MRIIVVWLRNLRSEKRLTDSQLTNIAIRYNLTVDEILFIKETDNE